MDKGQTTKQTKISTKDLVLTGLLTAIVFSATMFINIRLPISINGGLIHMGNIALFLTAFLFGKKKGAIAGAFGMGLFDILSGWTAWAPFTFVIRGVMGYVIGSISHANNKEGVNALYNIIAIILGGIWMIGGYYMTEVILYGNWLTPATSIPGNIVQIVFGCLSVILAPMLKKAIKHL
jgi:uncharacterized membrane protein